LKKKTQSPNSKRKARVLVIYYPEEQTEKIAGIVRKLMLENINDIPGCEITEPYNREDRDNLFLFIHKEQKEFERKVKETLGKK